MASQSYLIRRDIDDCFATSPSISSPVWTPEMPEPAYTSVSYRFDDETPVVNLPPASAHPRALIEDNSDASTASSDDNLLIASLSHDPAW